MVMQGYKQTEVGVIPEDWCCIRLGDIAKVTKLAGFEFTKYVVYSNQGDIIALRGLNVKNGKLILDDVKYIDGSDFSKLNRSKLFKDDLLFTYVGTVGEVALVDKNDKYYLAPNVALIRLSDCVDPTFCMKQILSTNFYKNEIQVQIATSSQPALSMANIRLFNVILPSLIEQKSIAEALSDVDNMISSLEKLIAKKKAIKQGAMQELLTGKKRLAGFDDNWETLSLAEIGAITGSGVDKKILPDEQPITLLNYTNVYHQVSISRKDLNHQVTASAEKIKNCYVLRGDVFLTPTSETPEEIAISAVASEDMLDVVYSYHVVRLRPNTCYNGVFINYALSTPMFREQAVQFAEGSGIRYVITLKKFKEMQLYIPTDKAEQDAIVSILSDMDNEIDSLEQKLAKTRQIKHGMMQQLLTGRIRIV